ncbi:hypothetical protein [Alteraurantiacibacter aquimixticola]|uniref:Uncharacterized protein n=1 Tax=Alteraurantiacibacter aquimixticola TaxID=2489173 RepID=A0A4T3F368_9SPHN|nr:hypothetical protein [Alteraurantiacibacter aquimixticola]TIX51696.1 hypothetical protein E5222_04395 [Alteraurantiacibacter aquimixticola]
MYEWVDRSYDDLEERPQLILWSMRRWWLDTAANGCGCSRVGPVFQSVGMMAALPFFQIMMLSLRDTMVQPKRLGRESVSEQEAVILSLLSFPASRDPEAVAGRLSGLVAPAKKQRTARAIAGFAARFVPTGLSGWKPDEESKIR